MIVWLASFPRSGNTFMRVLLHQCFGNETYSIHNDKYDIGKIKSLSAITGHTHFDENALAEMRADDKIYFIKTHRLNISAYLNDKVIYLIRDGRDATVSLAMYTKNFAPGYFSPIQIIDGEFAFGSWHEHVAAWSRKSDNIQIVKFEDLVENPLRITDKLADDFGLTYINRSAPVFSELHALNGSFFNSGQSLTYLQKMNEIEPNYFWLKSHEQMLANGYTENIPAIFTDEKHSLFLKSIAYQLEDIRNDQNRNKEGLKNEITTLNERQLQLKNKNAELEEQKKELEARKAKEIEELKACNSRRIGELEAKLAEERDTYAKAVESNTLLAKSVGVFQAELRTERIAYYSLAEAVHAWEATLKQSLHGKLVKLAARLPFRLMGRSMRGMGRPPLKFSIVTPSFNSGTSIEHAIKSVLDQKYASFEHIIVDGGSKDGTLDILKRYPHLKWVSEPDRGQVHAMTKGFHMATGDVVGYLNADDYYSDEAFITVAKAFDPDTAAVFGKVKVYSERKGKWWTNDPRTDFASVLRHWEGNSFCVNPVGYFCRREVCKAIPYREKNGAKHDLAFLIELSLRYQGKLKKIDKILGVFISGMNTQTGREIHKAGYWTAENFSFIDEFLATQPEEFQMEFRKAQAEGYAKLEKYNK